MLRITADTTTDGILHIRLDGHLTQADVPELATATEPALRGNARLVLEVSGLTYVDAQGAQFLRGLAVRDVTIRGYSDFVAKLLGLP
jgi:anti-anti-sigma regulatory factor